MNRRAFFSLFTAAIAAVPFLRRWVKPQTDFIANVDEIGSQWNIGWGHERHASHMVKYIDGQPHYYGWLWQAGEWQELHKDTDGYLKPKLTA